MNGYALLQSVKAVLPDKNNPEEIDILVNKDTGLIEKISRNIVVGDAEKISRYKGLHVLPGFIDPHVHFRIPGKPEAEDWKHGSLAAISAGVTTVLDMPNNNPPVTDEKSLKLKLNCIEKESLVNFGVFGGLTRHNLEYLLQEKNIKAIKVYLASTTGDMLIENIDNIDFSKSLKVICFHAEDEIIIQNNVRKTGLLNDPLLHSQIRSEEAAVKATQHVIHLYKKTNGNFHVAHVSTADEIVLLQNAGVSFECAPHHIFCNTDNYKNGGFLWKCNPPLRSPATQSQMRNFLHEERIQMIATDHAPHTLQDKQFDKNHAEKVPVSGIPSLEAGTHLILNETANGKISLEYTTRILSSNAAKRFHIQKRGLIEEGYYADLAVVDFNNQWTFSPKNIQSKCGWSPFMDFVFKTKVVATFVNGREFIIENLKSKLNMEKTNPIYQV
ncbi:MAG: dihydroorotase [Spirochaetia bacterium]|nr:dihydroorotase [Spirochaetia bacterium]